jgi:cysteine-rich repeat protein
MRCQMLVFSLAIAGAPALAYGAVDLTGTYTVSVASSFFGTQTGTFTFAQSGTAITGVADVVDGSGNHVGGPLAGTVDPATGAFDFPLPDTPIPSPPGFPPGFFPPCTGNGIRGTVSPDGTHLDALWAVAVPRISPVGGCGVNAEGPVTGVRQVPIDLTGTYTVTIQSLTGPHTGAFTFTQAGSDLTLDYDLDNAAVGHEHGTLPGGTINPATGAFSFPIADPPPPPPGFPLPTCTGNGLAGTATAGGNAISGTWVDLYPTMTVCVNTLGPFTGFRGAPECGDGVVVGDEQCDDGNTADGDCCSSTCRYEPAGSGCDDGDVCSTVDACDGAGTCTGSVPLTCPSCEACAPDVGCRPAPAPACVSTDGPASIVLSSAKRRLTYRSSTSHAYFRDPLTRTDYSLCVFASSGSTSTVVLRGDVPAGGTCGGTPCWTPTHNGPKYRDRMGMHDGVLALVLRGTGGPGAVLLRAAGPNLPLAPLPPSIDAVRVQLRGVDANGELCYGTDFPTVKQTSSGAHARR